MADRSRYLTPLAVEYIEEVASSTDLEQAVGGISVQHLETKVQAVYGALGGRSAQALAAAVSDLAQDCVTLPEWVDRDFEEEQGTGGEFCWAFGPATAEAVAAASAAVAGLSEPGLLPDGEAVSAELVLDVLEAFGRDLDCLAPYIYGGLCRAEAQEVCRADDPGSDGSSTPQQRVRRSLKAIAAWTLAAVGRSMGYEQLSPLILWELGGRDALWVLVLVRGALTAEALSGNPFEPPVAVVLAAPQELAELQQSAARATLGLPAAAVAFCEEADLVDSEQCTPAIAERSAQLAQHRAQLAAEVAGSQLLGPLLRVCAAFGLHFELASFLAALLQADVIESDPDWAHNDSTQEALCVARRGAEELRSSLSWHSRELWSCLAQAQVCSIPRLRSLLRDCSDIAFAAPLAASEASDDITRLMQDSLARVSEAADPGTMAACCALAANAGLQPGQGGSIAEMFVAMPYKACEDAAKLLATWRRPLRRSVLAPWLALLRQPPEGDASVEASPPMPPSAPVTSVPAVPGSALRQLLQNAPQELRCTLDGRLLTDPVQSPAGALFERSMLAQELARNGGICPVSGQPLNLKDCPRDAEVRRAAQRWARESKASRVQKPRGKLASSAHQAASAAQEEANFDNFFGM